MRRRELAALLGLAGLAVVGLSAAGVISPDVLFLLPALTLALPLLSGRYLGETTLARMSGARVLRRARARSAAPPRAAAFAVLPRGGLLIATSLAIRPPPSPAGG